MKKMEPEEKLAIFEKNDLSKSALIKRAEIEPEDPNAALYHDIAGMVQSMLLDFGVIANGKVRDVDEFQSTQNRIYRSYGWLQSKYQGIDWDELDPDDPDFSVFFTMKKLIDDLGKGINVLLERARSQTGNMIDSEEYRHIEKQIKKMGEGMQEYGVIREKLKEQVRKRRG